MIPAEWWLGVAILGPMLALPVLATRRPLLIGAVMAAAPAVQLVPLTLSGDLQLSVPWLLLEARFAVDALGGGLLLLSAPVSAAVLLMAVAQTQGNIRQAGLLAALTATICAFAGVLLAADLATFYFAYAVMTLGAYPLVVYRRDPEAFRAGRVYLGMAVLAEAAILAAVLLIAASGGNPDLAAVPGLVAEHPKAGLLVGLLLAGFAVKAGVVPLHAWLPLAHPAAPIPASALLSALLVKAALIGWWRLLPVGEVALPTLGLAVIAAGVVTNLYANLIGITQHRAKTVLAYSTVSQMGLLTTLLGLGLIAPGVAGAALLATVLFAIHHGLAKGALFLGCGLQGRGRGWYLLLPALALVGAPLTAGALGKLAIKEVAEPLFGPLAAWLLTALSVLTALLMVRLLALVARGEGLGGDAPASRGAVVGLIVAGLVVPWAVAALFWPELPGAMEGVGYWLDSSLPLIVGGALGAWLLVHRHGRDLPTIPEGDWIKPALLGGLRLRYALLRIWQRLPHPPRPPSLSVITRLSAAIESRLVAVAMSGVLFLVLVLGISLLGLLAGR